MATAALAGRTAMAAAPAAPADWGRPVGGLQAALCLEGEAAAGGALTCRVALASVGSPPAKVPPVHGACGWVLVAQKIGEDRRAFYGERVGLVEARRRPWPGGPGEEIIEFESINLSKARAYGSEHGRALLTAYLSDPSQADAVPSAGRLVELLVPGKAVARFTLCLPGPAGKPLAVTTAALEFDVAPAPWETLSPAARQALAARLLVQFDRSAWAAQKAHDEAVRIGRPLLADLVGAVRDTGRPSFSRMWLAAAIAEVPDARSVEALEGLMEDRDAGVRGVVAYYGPRQSSPALDRAITEKAKGGRDAQFTALALLGFLVVRGTAPPEIIEAGLREDDPRARAAAADALAGHRSHDTVARLAGLLADRDEHVRGVAAAVLGRADARAPNVLAALVEALDLPGESARRRICRALSDLTGRQGLYDPSADETTRRGVLEGWKAWWAGQGAPKP